jgi:hypothetical protein
LESLRDRYLRRFAAMRVGSKTDPTAGN